MIKNRLAVLLADRGLRISKVALDTGISRNSLTAISQNDSEMIRLDTINTLCKYLGVTPQDFFEFIPIDTKFDLLDLNCNLKVSNLDPYETEDFFTIENLKGSVQFSLDSVTAKNAFELSFFNQNKIYIPTDINKIPVANIDVHVVFANQADWITYTNFYQRYFSNFYNQTNSNLLKNLVEKELKTFLLNHYANYFENGSYFDDEFIEAVHHYVNVRLISTIFNPFQ